jgi:hypothetical protein
MLFMNQAELALLALLAIFLAEGSIDQTQPPAVTLESIKAAREKQDLEMKSDTKRPWDGMDLTGPNAFKKKQPTEGSGGQGDHLDR